MSMTISMYMCVFLLLSGVLTDMQIPDLFNHTGLTDYVHHHGMNYMSKLKHLYHNEKKLVSDISPTRLLHETIHRTQSFYNRNKKYLKQQYQKVKTGFLQELQHFNNVSDANQERLVKLAIWKMNHGNMTEQQLQFQALMKQLSKNPKFLAILRHQYNKQTHSSGNITYSKDECIRTESIRIFYPGYIYSLYVTRAPTYEHIKQCVATVLGLKTASFTPFKAYEGITIPAQIVQTQNTSDLVFKLSNCGSSFVCPMKETGHASIILFSLLGVIMTLLFFVVIGILYYTVSMVKERKLLKEYIFKHTDTCFVAEEQGSFNIKFNTKVTKDTPEQLNSSGTYKKIE